MTFIAAILLLTHFMTFLAAENQTFLVQLVAPVLQVLQRVQLLQDESDIQMDVSDLPQLALSLTFNRCI